jgi:hypothetical protein
VQFKHLQAFYSLLTIANILTHTLLYMHILRQNLRLHLYVSEPPCGDAAIFKLLQTENLDENHAQVEEEEEGRSEAMNFSGAKLIVSDHNNSGSSEGNEGGSTGNKVEVVREPKEQSLGHLRLKSGRSDIE